MQINQVSNLNFEGSDKIFFSESAKKNIQQLMRKMNYATVYTENPSSQTIESKILATIDMGNKVQFSDNRFYFVPVRTPKEDICDCSIKIGTNELFINSTTGEVVKYDISWLSSMKRVIKKAEKYINIFLQQFDNPQVVNRRILPVEWYTQKGYKKAQAEYMRLR